jgi:hypothetical protein
MKWPQDWINTALELVRTVWREKYNIVTPSSSLAASRVSSTQQSKVSRIVASLIQAHAAIQSSDIDFDVVINYELEDIEMEDCPLERYLRLPPKADCDDPIAYWSQQKAAGVDPKLAQMALDFLMAPGDSLYSIIRMLLFINSQ